jgi:16S rRNA (cytosine967-C5)-methyltransferase
LQQALLNHAASLLKPGGRIVYSTCALEFEENEAQIRHFLTAHPDFVVAIPEDFAPDFQGSRSPEGLLILPRLEEPDGFFMTRLVKLRA